MPRFHIPALTLASLFSLACGDGANAGPLEDTGGHHATGGAGQGVVGAGGVVGPTLGGGGTQAGTGGQGTGDSGGSPNTGGSDTGGTGGRDGSGGDDGSGIGHHKFVGNITTHNQVDYGGLDYSTYWDQITPENAGKWGSVQSTTNSGMNWSTLDAIYDYAEDHDIIFKQHAFVWGSQQPEGAAPTEQQVKDWIRSFCERYPNTPLIDVVNEPPPHTEPNYANNIGGGTNGDWAWISNSFKWAREYCGEDAILILNDYNNIEWTNDNQRFIDIVTTIKENGAPIDAVGAQSHDLDHDAMNLSTVTTLLNKLHDDTGLPVYITELDLSYTSDQAQLDAYQTYFPLFQDAEFVKGITIWGWIDGATWHMAPNSGLVKGSTPRPAMAWLMDELGRPSP